MPPEDRDRLSTALERLLRTSVCFLYRTCGLYSSESVELRARHGAVPVFSAPRLPQPHHSPELDDPARTVGPSGPSEQGCQENPRRPADASRRVSHVLGPARSDFRVSRKPSWLVELPAATAR